MLRHLITRLAGRSRSSGADRLLQAAQAARARGDLDLAADLLARASEEAPGRVAPRCLLADVYLEQGDHLRAENLLREIIATTPSDAQAHELLGRALRRRGAAQEAARAFHRAIELDWHGHSARSELAAALIELGRPQEAIPLLHWVLKRVPELASAHLNCGMALQETGRLDQALPCFERACALEPENIGHMNHLAMCLRGLDRHEDSVRELERALALVHDEPSTITNLALVLRELGRAELAHAAVAPLVARQPDHVPARAAMALVLQDLGDYPGARAQYDLALDLAPRSGAVRLGRALLRLAQSDFAEGWDDYEGRLDSPESPRRGFPYPDWQDGAIAGRTILVYAEQGLGDEIMFASCLPDLIAEAGRVVVECDPRLASLFQRSFPGASVYGAPRTWEHPWLAEAGAIDVQAAAGSLPRHYRRAIARFPALGGYLRPDVARVSHYRTRLAALGQGRKIGIAWRGGMMRTRQSVRSISPEGLAPLIARRDLHYVSVQHGPVEADLARIRALRGAPITHWPEAVSDPDEAAALMTALDAVVTVCSSVVHLGGALGARVITMVPATPEWRYLNSGTRMPWYPTVELMRQDRPGDWTTVVNAVAGLI
jgi:tetratricopeptide (TPR) repeat protein